MSSLVPETWAIEAISNISKVGSSKRILQSEYVADGVPFFRSKEVILRSKRKQIKDTLYIARSRFDELKSKFGAPKPNDILVTAVGTIGTIYLIEDIEFYFKDGNLLWIKDINDSVHPQYLAKYMASDIFQTAIERISGGSSQSALTIEKLSQLELNLPPLPEQQKIAEILTSVDEVIEKTQTQIDKLKDLKTAMMQELLTKGVCDESGKRHIEFKDSPVGKIPVEWEVKSIGDFVEDMVGGAPLRPNDFSDEGFRVIPKKAVQFGGELIFGKKTFCTNEFAGNYKKNIVSNEYLITTLRDLVPSGPTIGVIGELIEKGQFVLAQGVYGLKTYNIENRYLVQLSNSGWYRKEMRKVFVGSTQVHIRNQEFLDILIPIPPLYEQVKIANSLTSIDGKIRLLLEKSLSLKNVKKALMQDLLTGKVRVNLSS
jgi:type I restriction enzyme S subunit